MRPLGADDPTRIGDYRLLGLLGVGGMGRVYLGRNTGGRTVAVKVIRPDLIEAEFRERFRREVAAARRVGGACTAPVLDADVDADPPWLATGYVAGLSLAEAIEQYGPFGENALLVLAHGLAEALVAVHGAGVVHRDLKPSNVLLTLDGPRVIDFGIARAVEDSALTATGQVIGSPGFMCPEQVTGEVVGPPGDVFALGGVLVFAASGSGPFGTGEVVPLLWRVMYEEPQLAALPPRLRPLVAACLAKDVAARPTPAELLAELTALGIPDRGGWLPAPAVEEVSRRAIQLLDLDSGSIHRGLDSPPVPDPARVAETVVGTPRPDSRREQTSGAAPSSAPQWRNPGPPHPFEQQFSHKHAHPVSSQPNHFPPQGVTDRSPRRPGSIARPRRAVLIGGALVLCVAVAFSAFAVGARLNKTHKSAAESTHHSEIPSAAAKTSAARESSVTTVPKAFLGEWKGVAKDQLAAFDIVLTIKEGKLGEEVASSSNTGKVWGSRCERAETMTAATESEIDFTARLSGGAADCMDDGSTSKVTLNADGSLTYHSSSLLGGMEGVLRKN